MNILKSLDKSPWWAQLAVWAGLPGALLTFIIYVGLTGIAGATTETNVIVKEHLPTHVQQQTEFLNKLDDYLWLHCRRANKTEPAIVAKCDEIHERSLRRQVTP